MDTKDNCLFITDELSWLECIIITRLKLYFDQEVAYGSVFDIPLPNTLGREGIYPQLIEKYSLSFEERLALILSLVPTLKPQLLDAFHIKNSHTEKRFVEFGCIELEASQTLLPTFETLLFLLSSDNLVDKIQYTNLVSKSVLFREKIISLQSINNLLPLHYSVLSVPLATVELLINGTDYLPDFSPSFPASRITTACSWSDLILGESVMQQIEEIKTWLQYGNSILEEWGLKNKVKQGYRVLFHGPSGTGKSFTASLLGKETGKDVYRIDLSMIVSKYIGETEKNLSNIFDKAENKDWILFFDEADALFGKRTSVNDSHDRYANQEISFLLQRIENYNGLVILSTNLKRNIDEAFIRRFQSIIYFPLPKATERRVLWKNTFSPKTILGEGINLDEVAEKYDLTGASIVNIVQYCSLMAKSRGSSTIELRDLMDGINKEYQKEGKTI